MNISNTVVSQSHNCWILMLPFNLLAVDTAYKSTAIENGHHVRIFLYKNIKNLEIPRIIVLNVKITVTFSVIFKIPRPEVFGGSWKSH